MPTTSWYIECTPGRVISFRAHSGKSGISNYAMESYLQSDGAPDASHHGLVPLAHHDTMTARLHIMSTTRRLDEG